MIWCGYLGRGIDVRVLHTVPSTMTPACRQLMYDACDGQKMWRYPDMYPDLRHACSSEIS